MYSDYKYREMQPSWQYYSPFKAAIHRNKADMAKWPSTMSLNDKKTINSINGFQHDATYFIISKYRTDESYWTVCGL